MIQFLFGVIVGFVLIPLARALVWHLQQWRESKRRIDVLSPEWKWKMIQRERGE